MLFQRQFTAYFRRQSLEEPSPQKTIDHQFQTIIDPRPELSKLAKKLLPYSLCAKRKIDDF
jgi:hypothetical protein